MPWPRRMKNSLISLFLTSAAASAAWPNLEWKDTSVGVRYGTSFAEPYESDDITKTIFHFTHANGYKYGTNFLNIDYLLSGDDDPKNLGSDAGAWEVYVLYRHLLDIGKVTGQSLAFGPVRGVGLTTGFDWNHKNDTGYNSRKQMLVLGPTVMMDVPGFLNISVLGFWESNSPYSEFTQSGVNRYHYDFHPALCASWSVPIEVAGQSLSFDGYANIIASKGDDEFGNGTAPETNIDMQVMYDASQWFGLDKNSLKLGIEYQFWRNKFGNDHDGPAGDGAFANTPMVRMEWHF